MKRHIYLILLTMASCFLFGCTGPVDRSPYPVDRSLDLAALQQRDFVDSFLQGRWCEAQSLYASSLEGRIRRDEFCAAAKTARLAARLKAYLGQNAPDELAAAKRFASATEECPGIDSGAMPERDRRYTALIDSGNLSALASQLEKEEDALYASVYARKGAAMALEAGDNTLAETLWRLARSTDAAHGWVAFLREDWRLRLSMETAPLKKQAIHERIGILDEQINPCP